MTQQPIFINRARAFVIAQFSVGGLMVLLALLLIPVSPSTLVLLGAGLVLFALWVLWQGIRAHQHVNANAPNVVPTPKAQHANWYARASMPIFAIHSTQA
jgi:hypothetical protein